MACRLKPSAESNGAARCSRPRLFFSVARLSDSVFRSHPEIVDHRQEFPWLTACLGDPFAKAWFVAENPSLTPVRVSRATSPEHQWSGGRGADLLREMLAKHGFKTGGPFAAGGWRCYITDVIKSAAVVKEWNALPAESHQMTAEAWAPVLRYELEVGEPELLVVLGAKTERLLVHLERERLCRAYRV